MLFGKQKKTRVSPSIPKQTETHSKRIGFLPSPVPKKSTADLPQLLACKASQGDTNEFSRQRCQLRRLHALLEITRYDPTTGLHLKFKDDYKQHNWEYHTELRMQLEEMVEGISLTLEIWAIRKSIWIPGVGKN